MCQSDVMDGRTYVLIPTMSFGRFSRNLTSLLGPRLFSLYLTMCGFKILSLAVTKVPLAVLSVCQSWSYASLRSHKQFWTQFFPGKMTSAEVGRKIILSSHLFRRLSAFPATGDPASLFRQQWPIHYSNLTFISLSLPIFLITINPISLISFFSLPHHSHLGQTHPLLWS